jgi:hypothetical protein
LEGKKWDLGVERGKNFVAFFAIIARLLENSAFLHWALLSVKLFKDNIEDT